MGATVIRRPGDRNGFGAPGSITIDRIGDAPSVNLSILGTLDWFIAHTTTQHLRALTSSRHHKAGGGFMFRSFDGTTGGQGTSTTLMSGTTRSATTNDAIEFAVTSTTTSFGISTPNTSVAFGVQFQAPSGGGFGRKLRVYWGNAFNVARLTCRLDDGTEQFIEIDNSSTIQTHEHEITFAGASVLDVLIKPQSRYVGTQNLAFCGASLGLAA